MKGTSAAWELLVCTGIGLLVSGISNGLSNFFVVVTCVAVAVSWLTFSNVTAGLLFLMVYLFLLMVASITFPFHVTSQIHFFEDSVIPCDRRSFVISLPCTPRKRAK